MSDPASRQREPLAIRSAVERGWAAFACCPWTLMGFALISGGLNLLSQLLYRHQSSLVISLLGRPDPVPIVLAGITWVLYVVTGLWLVVGLMRGALLALNQQRPQLVDLLRLDGRAMLRCLGTLVLFLAMLALIVRLAQASSWLLTLIQPALAPLPLLAGLAAAIYFSADQILSLPLTLVGGLNPLAAFRCSRAATDPHWLQALGLALVLLGLVLAGFLVLLVGLVVTLPLAACTLTAAYQQLFGSDDPGRLTGP